MNFDTAESMGAFLQVEIVIFLIGFAAFYALQRYFGSPRYVLTSGILAIIFTYVISVIFAVLILADQNMNLFLAINSDPVGGLAFILESGAEFIAGGVFGVICAVSFFAISKVALRLRKK